MPGTQRSAPSGLLQIGIVGRPHGVRGEFKLRLHFEGSDALNHVSELTIEPPGGSIRRLQLESVRGLSKEPIIFAREIGSREQAEEIKGAVCWIARSALPAPEPGEYFLVDLVGCEVVVENRTIGAIEQVRPDPSVDTMIIRLTDGKLAEQPIVDAWVKRVDIEGKRVDLENEDGLIIS